MTPQSLQSKILKPVPSVELVLEPLADGDLNDLCDATDSAIENGGGFGWVEKPSRDILESFWAGVITIPSRLLFVARLDGVICGTAQLILPPKNNQAQKGSAQIMSLFITPWARGHRLGSRLLSYIEKVAYEKEINVLNLDVRESQEAAISLYEKNNYVQIGYHPYYAEIDGTAVAGRYYMKVIHPKHSEHSEHSKQEANNKSINS